MVSRRRVLAGLGAGSLAVIAGCSDATDDSANDDGSSDGQGDGVEAAVFAAIDEHWDARRDADPDALRETYHSDAPIRDEEFWDDERFWEDALYNDFEWAPEDREVVDGDGDEAVVREMGTRTHEDRSDSQNLIFVHELRREDGEWFIYDQEAEPYVPWMDGDVEPSDFEPCGRLVVRVEELPEFVRTEVEKAFQEGSYEAEELYLPHLIDVEDSYLGGPVADAGGDTYFRAHVSATDGAEQLELEEVRPSRGPSDIRLDNQTDDAVTVSITVEREAPDVDADGTETVLEETFDIAAGESVSTERFERYFVDHWAYVETGDESERIEWRESELSIRMRHVFVTPDGVVEGPEQQIDPVDCRGVWMHAVASP